MVEVEIMTRKDDLVREIEIQFRKIKESLSGTRQQLLRLEAEVTFMEYRVKQISKLKRRIDLSPLAEVKP